MKRISIFLASLTMLCACSHDIDREAYFKVTLSSANTYMAGEPVVFNFSGDIDNVLFYSGEQGSEYQYKDRY